MKKRSMEGSIIAGITLQTVATSTGLSALLNANASRIKLAIYRNILGWSIYHNGLNLQPDRKSMYRYWILCINLSLEYNKRYRNGSSDEHEVLLSDDVMYLLLYAPTEIRDYFWDVTGNYESYVPKRCSIILPCREFRLYTDKEEIKGKNTKRKASVALTVKVLFAQNSPVMIRSITRQWFWGKGNQHSLATGRKLQRNKMKSMQNFKGLDSLIDDVLFAGNNNQRYLNYLKRKNRFQAERDGGGNPEPMNIPHP